MRVALLLISAAAACNDYDAVGCATRSQTHADFCASAWGRQRCCRTCHRLRSAPPAPEGCLVPRQACASWSCGAPGTRLKLGATCVVEASSSPKCSRCGLVDADTCKLWASANRTCVDGGRWAGPEPACGAFCFPEEPEEELPRRLAATAVEAAELPHAAPIRVTPLATLSAAAGSTSHASAWLNERLHHWMRYKVEVFGHWFVVASDRCMRLWTESPVLHVARLFAGYLDWEGTGVPNNPGVMAALKRRNATMAMFNSDNRELQDFSAHVDQQPWIHYMDLECDETPHSEPQDPNSFDNAYCEITQQLFEEGYSHVYPDVFCHVQGGCKITEAMDETIGDCGHAYDNTFTYPLCTGKYHYADRTCDYACLAAQYEYWALTSLLGGQDGSQVPPASRCEDIAKEWELCSPALMRSSCPKAYSIMTDPAYKLPTRLPLGDYSISDIVV